MSEQTKEEAALLTLIELVVDEPQSVRIDSMLSEHSAVFDIHVADNDVGKVLGRKGTHANALRIIFGAVYGKMGKRLHLQVVDPRRP